MTNDIEYSTSIGKVQVKVQYSDLITFLKKYWKDSRVKQEKFTWELIWIETTWVWSLIMKDLGDWKQWTI